MSSLDTFVLAQSLIKGLSLCTLQPHEPGNGYLHVCADVLPGNAIILTSHAIPDEDQENTLGTTTADIELSPDGWRTLVEMFALRRPEAFEQIVIRWRAFKELRG